MIFANPLFWAFIFIFAAICWDASHQIKAINGSEKEQGAVTRALNECIEVHEDPLDQDEELSERIFAAARAKGIEIDHEPPYA
jgi:hypothetical protein